MTHPLLSQRVGAHLLPSGACRFLLWAPKARAVTLHLPGPPDRREPMRRLPHGYHEAELADVAPGARYWYQLDGGRDLPDPASRWQPEGVHGPSAVAPTGHAWTDDAWRGIPLSRYVIYELHVGTFTAAGDFAAAIQRLDYLRDLGVTAVEVMPLAQFPGGRNWGYDGVYPFAAQSSYGGPAGFKAFVDACHARGLAVVLDVVYNHLGPEGNYLREFGPYFTRRYGTPWGEAVNYDGPQSDGVRNYVAQNALQWFGEFHVDALRLDALHAIFDFSARPFLRELAAAVRELEQQAGRPLYLIAESDLNDTRLLRSPETGGDGLHAQWLDDFHHAVHVRLTGERVGYYADFGELEQVRQALAEGFVYNGKYSAFRERRFGEPSTLRESGRFVAFTQNHDQIGNRPEGDRLSTMLPLEAQKLAAGLLLLSPYVPLLFMGQEYGETAPFQYFVSHTDAGLVEAVRRGRAEEFADLMAGRETPDPQDAATFERSRIDPTLADRSPHRELLALHRELLRLRRDVPALANLSWDELTAQTVPDQDVVLLHRWWGEDAVWAAFNLAGRPVAFQATLPPGDWRLLLDSADPQWLGPGAAVPPHLTGGDVAALALPAHSFVAFHATEATEALR